MCYLKTPQSRVFNFFHTFYITHYTLYTLHKLELGYESGRKLVILKYLTFIIMYFTCKVLRKRRANHTCSSDNSRPTSPNSPFSYTPRSQANATIWRQPHHHPAGPTVHTHTPHIAQHILFLKTDYHVEYK